MYSKLSRYFAYILLICAYSVNGAYPHVCEHLHHLFKTLFLLFLFYFVAQTLIHKSTALSEGLGVFDGAEGDVWGEYLGKHY